MPSPQTRYPGRQSPRGGAGAGDPPGAGAGTHPCALGCQEDCEAQKPEGPNPLGLSHPKLRPRPLKDPHTHHHPHLLTGWAPSPGTSASGPCGGGNGGGGGRQSGWWVRGPAGRGREGPRGGAGVPAWRWSASWGWHPRLSAWRQGCAQPERGLGGSQQRAQQNSPWEGLAPWGLLGTSLPTPPHPARDHRCARASAQGVLPPQPGGALGHLGGRGDRQEDVGTGKDSATVGAGVIRY